MDDPELAAKLACEERVDETCGNRDHVPLVLTAQSKDYDSDRVQMSVSFKLEKPRSKVTRIRLFPSKICRVGYAG
jgi:hypothetical protein